MGKRLVRYILLPLMLAAALLLAVQYLLVAHMRMAETPAFPCLARKQSLWVSLTAYGLRLPGERLWGVQRIGHGRPGRGDYVVYYTATGGRAVGICRALPGEAVWYDPAARTYLPARTSDTARSIEVPQGGRRMKADAAHAPILAHLLRTYEDTHAEVDARGRLLVGGSEIPSVTIPQDYYWIETQPGAYVFIPHENLVGRIMNVK